MCRDREEVVQIMCVCLAPCRAPRAPLLCDRCNVQHCNALSAARFPRSRAAHIPTVVPTETMVTRCNALIRTAACKVGRETPEKIKRKSDKAAASKCDKRAVTATSFMHIYLAWQLRCSALANITGRIAALFPTKGWFNCFFHSMVV